MSSRTHARAHACVQAAGDPMEEFQRILQRFGTVEQLLGTAPAEGEEGAAGAAAEGEEGGGARDAASQPHEAGGGGGEDSEDEEGDEAEKLSKKKKKLAVGGGPRDLFFMDFFLFCFGGMDGWRGWRRRGWRWVVAQALLA